MRKLLISTTALSVAISPLGTMPGFAQVLNEDGSVTGPDGSVLCTPTADAACDIDAIIAALQEAELAAQLEAEAAAAAALEAELAAQAEAAAQAEVEAAAAEAAAAEAAAQAEAEAEAAAQAEADAAAQAEAEAAAQAAADAELAAQLEAEAAAAEAEAAAQAAADAEAAAQAEAAAAAAEADAAAQAEAEAAAAQAAADAEAAAQAAAEAEAAAAAAAETEAATEEPAAEETVVEEPAAEEPATEEPVAEEPAAEEAAAEEPAVEEPAAEEPVLEELATEEAVIEDPAGQPVTVLEGSAEGIIDPATGEVIDLETATMALEAAEEELAITPEGLIIDPAAGLKVAEPLVLEDIEPVDTPVVSETEVEGLTELLTADPTILDPSAVAAAQLVSEAPPAEDGTVITLTPDPEDLIGAVTETVIPETARTSSEEFAAPPVATSAGKKSGLSDLEKAGLLVLGALAVGAIIKSSNDEKEDRRVVSNTGDRVIVLQPDGTYRVLKDDDTIIRRPGSTVRTETFRDGSTRTIVERADGTQVVTIRDATGRVLRRATYDDRGREVILIDDLEPEEVVIIRDLPRPKKRIVISSKDDDAALKRELAALEADKAGRKFSLRQIREIPEVRALAATIDVEPVTFASGSAAIAAAEARNLADLGRVMQELLDENPREVFLIEGHTDATGKAAMNLALSDRRAESVALALTEYFDIPPENMVVQGYGETELLIDTLENEPRNRRVEVRVITPLMHSARVE